MDQMKLNIRFLYSKIRIYFINIGILETLLNFCIKKSYDILSKLRVNTQGWPLYFFIKGYPRPILLRYGTTDKDVFYQVFVQQEFGCLKDIKEPHLVIDCGGYAGYTGVYFLEKFPNAHIIVIEPELGNFILAQKNTSRYGNRIELIRSAIWSNRVGLVVCKNNSGDWATKVRIVNAGEKPDIFSIDIESLIKKSGFESVDILKIDIEKSECALFSCDYKWISKVKNIVIELHDKEAEDVFFKALSDYNYELSRSGEHTICKNIEPICERPLNPLQEAQK